MPPWLQRVLTLTAAAAAGTLAIVFPVTAPVLGPVAAALGGWAVPHPADVNLKP